LYRREWSDCLISPAESEMELDHRRAAHSPASRAMGYIPNQGSRVDDEAGMKLTTAGVGGGDVCWVDFTTTLLGGGALLTWSSSEPPVNGGPILRY